MIRRRFPRTTAIALALAIPLTALPAQPADAIPAFSRKYGTSCATCHVAFPKLNAFGRAFRNNGYRMPGGDEQYLRDENVKLGAEPWKRLWPNAIWPGDLPYLPPISLLVENELQHNPDGVVETDFRTPSDIALLTGGSFGDTMSFFGRINAVAPGEDLHVHRFFGQFNRMFGTPLLNLRIGQVEPRSVPFSSNRRLAKEDYLLNTATLPLEQWVDYLASLPDPDDGVAEPAADDGIFGALVGLMTATSEGEGVDEGTAMDPRPALIGTGGHQHGGAAFSLGTTQLGAELWGATTGFGGTGGLEYAVGVVNGNGAGDFAATGTNDNNRAKDLYWRASYKLGGLSVIGDPESAPAATNNWQDDSVRVGVFGYHGTAPFTFGHEEEEEEHVETASFFVPGNPEAEEDLDDEILPAPLFADESFHRIGADVDIWLGDINVFGAYMWGDTEMESAMLEDADLEVPVLFREAESDLRAWLAQADYMVYPWLVTSLRYEGVDYDEAFGEVERWVPHVTALLRANVKLNVEANLYSDEAFQDRYRFRFDFAF